MSAFKRIGLIGVGYMGHGIGLNVAKNGLQLTYLNHPGNQPTADLDALGAKGVDDIGELSAASDAIILCVNGSPQVEAIVLGENGLIKRLGAGQMLVDCSTAKPRSTMEVAKAVQATGCRFVDAPMTRTPKEAAEGRLNLLVGGSEEDFDAIKPVLDTFSEVARRVGPIASGHQMKLLHNFVSVGSIALLSEAAACANKCGLDPEVFVDVLRQGGGRGAALDRLAPYLTEKDASGLKFSMANGSKDLDYYNALAEGESAYDGVAKAVQAMLQAQLANGNADRLMPELVDLLG